MLLEERRNRCVVNEVEDNGDKHDSNHGSFIPNYDAGWMHHH